MSDELEIYDDDGVTFGDWSDAVPWKMKRWTEHRLQLAYVEGSAQTVRFVESELSRRRNKELKDHIKALKEVAEFTREATVGVKDGVCNLAASSEKLERLTKQLKWLTWVLIVLTALAVVVPIAIELRQPEKPVRVVVQYPPPAAPQPPPLPAR